MNPDQLRNLIQVTLKSFDRRIPYSEEAVELLMMTASHESRLGQYIHQVSGPAMGIFQMEPDTFFDIKGEYLSYRSVLNQETSAYFVDEWDPTEVSWNLKAAVIMARLHYYRVPVAIPESKEEKAAYCKIYWNTVEGSAEPIDYLNAYDELVLKLRTQDIL